MDILYHHLVCNINNHEIQWRLLSENDLRYQEVVELALAMEISWKMWVFASVKNKWKFSGTKPENRQSLGKQTSMGKKRLISLTNVRLPKLKAQCRHDANLKSFVDEFKLTWLKLWGTSAYISKLGLNSLKENAIMTYSLNVLRILFLSFA